MGAASTAAGSRYGIGEMVMAGDFWWRRWRRPRRLGVVALALLLLLGSATAAFGHLALVSASPGDADRLDRVPPAIELRFTEPVELPLFVLTLAGPDGAVALGPPEGLEGNQTVRLPILGGLRPAEYSISWQAVGRDGHPVRGEYTFTIEEGAEGAASPADVAAPAEEGPAAAPPPERLPTFSSQSPLYAAVRWLAYLGIIGTAGAVGFSMLLRISPALGDAGQFPSFRAAAMRGSAALGIFAVLLLVISLPLRLQAQSHALFGAGITSERFGIILGSIWGMGWLVQATGCVAALAGLVLARAGLRAGWPLASLGVLAFVATPGLSGHAAAVESYALLTMIAHGGHILGAGLWLGTLFAIVVVALPLVRREAAGSRGSLLTHLLQSFSPLALAAGGLVALTGIFAASVHLQHPSDLWTSPYGRLLLAKLFLVLIVFGTGAYNWRFVRPRVGHGSGGGLRRVASAELSAAILVLALTALLVAVPPPSHGARHLTAEERIDAAP